MRVVICRPRLNITGQPFYMSICSIVHGCGLDAFSSSLPYQHVHLLDKPRRKVARERYQIQVEYFDELLVHVPRLLPGVHLILRARVTGQRCSGLPWQKVTIAGHTSFKMDVRFHPCSLRRQPTKAPVWCIPKLHRYIRMQLPVHGQGWAGWDTRAHGEDGVPVDVQHDLQSILDDLLTHWLPSRGRPCPVAHVDLCRKATTSALNLLVHAQLAMPLTTHHLHIDLLKEIRYLTHRPLR